MDITVTITDQEAQILESWLGSGMIQKWLQDAINNKVRQRVDASILESTSFNPKKMKHEDKLKELNKVDLPARDDRSKI